MQSKKKLDQFTQLAHAISANNVDELETLLKTNKDLDIQNSDGDTLLHLTLKQNPEKIVKIIKLLLNAGADPHVLNRNGDSFLDVFCSSNLLSNETKSLLFSASRNYIDPYLIKEENKKFLPKMQYNRTTCIMLYSFSIEHDHDTVMSTQATLAVTASQDPMLVNIKKVSRLFISLYIEKLLRANDTGKLFDVFNKYEIDPTFSFLENDIKINIANCIINNKSASLNREQKWEFIYKLYVLNFPLPLDVFNKAQQDVEAIPKLMEFFNNYNTPGLKDFLENDPTININIKLPDGRTLLDHAYTRRYFSQQQITQTAKKPITDTEKTNLLESKKADITEQESTEQLREKSEDFFQLVLKKSNIHAATTNNQTFLHLVTSYEDKPPLIEIAHYLLRGADPCLEDNYKNTALSYFTRKKMKDLEEPSDIKSTHEEKSQHPLDNHILLLTNGIEYYLNNDTQTQLLYDMLIEDKKRISNTDQDDETLRKEIIDFLKPLIDDLPIMADFLGRTELHRAISTGNVARSLHLIEGEFKPNIIEIQDNLGDTALHTAIMMQQIPIVKALIAKGASINILNEKKESPIHIAVSSYQTEILLEILKQTDLDEESVNLIFKTAYSKLNDKVIMALVTRYSSKIKLDVQFIESLNCCFFGESDANSYYNILYILIKYNVLSKNQLNNQEELLTKVMFSNHFNPNLTSVLLDETPAKKYLDMILAHSDVTRDMRVEILKVLLDKANTFNISSADQYGNTFLHIAVDLNDINNNKISWIRLLLTKGADPNIKNNKSFSPLHKAVQQLKPDLVKMLLQSGADPLLDSHYSITRFIPFFRNTPLDYAIGLNNDYKSKTDQYAHIEPPYKACNRHFKELFATYPGKNPTFFGSIMHSFSGIFPYINYSQKHLHYLLNQGISLENMPDVLKKPYPALLKALIQYTIDENSPDVLKTILMRYSDEQFSFLKADKTLSQKMMVCLNLKEKPIAPNIKINILKKLKKFSSPSDIKKITAVEKSIKTEENIFNVLDQQGKPAFFEKRMLYFQMLKAVNNSNFAAVKELFEKNPSYDFNIKDKEGRTLLDVAYTRNRKYERSLEEKTPLQELKSAEEYAASKDIFMLLLARLNINDRTKNNKTLLHIAVENSGSIEDILTFLLMGADISLKNTMGKQAFEYSLTCDGPLKEKMQSPENYNLLAFGLPSITPKTLTQLAKSIDTKKIEQLSSYSSLPASSKQILDNFIRIAKELQPTPNGNRI